MSSYNERLDRYQKATSKLVSMILHLTRPSERFPAHSVEQIKDQWRFWNAEDVLFRSYSDQPPMVRTFPEPPQGKESACWQMWGCLVLAQAEYRDHSFHTSFIAAAVYTIRKTLACKSHPDTCPCKVPNNPWICHDCVKLLEPLYIKHNPQCQCAGWDAHGRLNPCEQLGKTYEQIVCDADMKMGLRAHEVMMERSRAEEKMEAMYRMAQAREDKELRKRAELKLTAIAADSPGAVEKATATLARAEQNLKTCVCDASHSGVACVCFPRRKAEAEMASDNLRALQELAPAAAPAAAKAEPSPYDYKHNVDTCACGTCHKARMDSGRSDVYSARVMAMTMASAASASTSAAMAASAAKAAIAAAAAASAAKAAACAECPKTARPVCMDCHVEKNAYDEKGNLQMPSFLHTLRKGYVMGEGGSRPTDEGGSRPTDENDFAKQIFAAMGTPYDSICPHGQPFYSCMACSH